MKEKKRIIRSAIAIVLGCIATFFVGYGFSLWNFNPGTWSQDARVGLAIMCGLAVIGGIGFGAMAVSDARDRLKNSR